MKNSVRKVAGNLSVLTVCLALPFVTHADVTKGGTEWASAPSLRGMESVDLKTAILQAFSRSPSVTQQAYQMGIGQAQIREAQSAWYPQVGLNANTGSST